MEACDRKFCYKYFKCKYHQNEISKSYCKHIQICGVSCSADRLNSRFLFVHVSSETAFPHVAIRGHIGQSFLNRPIVYHLIDRKFSKHRILI